MMHGSFAAYSVVYFSGSKYSSNDLDQFIQCLSALLKLFTDYHDGHHDTEMLAFAETQCITGMEQHSLH